MNSTTWNRIVLGISLLGFILIYLHAVADFSATFSSPVHIGHSAQSTLLTVFLLGAGYFIYQLFSGIEFFNIEELLGYIIIVGLLALLFSVLPDMLIWGGIGWASTGTFELIYYALSVLFILFYFYLCFILFHRLTQVRQSTWGRRFWYFLITVIVLSSVFNYFNFERNNPFAIAFCIVAGLALLLHFIRLNWIALLSTRVKVYTIVLIAIVVLISLGLTQKLYKFPLAVELGVDLSGNMFLVILLAFVNGYGLFSLAALLFNMPIASVMDKKHTELEGFREISKVIEDNSSQEEILKLLFKRCLESTQAAGGWIVVIDPKEKAEAKLLQEGISDKDLKRIYLSISGNRRHFSIDVETNYLYIKDFRQDRFLKNHDVSYRSMVIFPITINQMPVAKLYLLKNYQNGFDEYSIDLILSYVVQTKLSIYNANLLHQTLESERLKKDLEIGKSQQKRLLPGEFPAFAHVEIAALSVPAEEVGGDYYDFYNLPDGRTAFIIADVSGKGTLAAFHVAEMKGIFQSLVLMNPDPAVFLQKANEAVSSCFDKGMFITLIYIIFNWETSEAIYSRAGHCPLVYFCKEKNEVSVLDDEGLGLGIVRTDDYIGLISQQLFKFRPGDLIVLHTDGILEARNEQNMEEFGLERLKGVVRSYNYMPVQELLQTIVKQVDSFTAGAPKHDDLSLMVFKIK